MYYPAEFRTDMCATVSEAVVYVTGEIDLETSPVLHRTLLEALAGHPRRLEVDFTDVTFCDCSGLSTWPGPRHKRPGPPSPWSTWTHRT
ncbi:STAS domain-containing protein [Streptomyces mirabilis]|nr:STAS domain-containing protein [Streptomyces mirabilis]